MAICINAISLPDVKDLRKTLHPFLHDRLEKVYWGEDHQGNTLYELLPTRIPLMERKIDLDCDKIIPMPDSIKLTLKEEYKAYKYQGIQLREENRLIHGFEDWDDWATEYWGSRWIGDGKFHRFRRSFLFSSSSCPPIPVVKKLAKILQTTVQIDFEHEDGMGFLGRSICRPDGQNFHISYLDFSQAPFALILSVKWMLEEWQPEEYEGFKDSVIRECEPYKGIGFGCESRKSY